MRTFRAQYEATSIYISVVNCGWALGRANLSGNPSNNSKFAQVVVVRGDIAGVTPSHTQGCGRSLPLKAITGMKSLFLPNLDSYVTGEFTISPW